MNRQRLRSQRPVAVLAAEGFASGGPRAACELEPLVLTVAALGGERAGTLLSGLAEPLRRRALVLLERIERADRAERHAALGTAFAPGRPPCSAAEGIPGALGARVRGLLAPGEAPPGPPIAGALERWGRRLALECSALAVATVG